MIDSKEKFNFYSLKAFLIWAIIIQIFRFICLYFQLHLSDLYVDEVYYWGWSQHFELGYYSKPPVLSWLIMLTTQLFGESEWAIKIGAILVYPLTSVVIYLITNRLFKNEQIAFYSALAFITLPAVSLSSMIISTDVVLLFFWSLSLYFFIKAIQEDKLKDWLLLGIMAGLGMLSKYNMAFFLISAILVLLLKKEYRQHFKNKKFYIALLLSMLIFSLNVYWQYTHDFVSFVHTEEISQIEGELFHLNKMLEFLGSQFAILGPIFFALLLFLLFKFRTLFKDEPMKILYLFVIPYFLFITTLSLLSRAFANWSAPVYIAGTILVVAYLIQKKHLNWVKYSIGFNIFLALFFYFYQPLTSMLPIELKAKADPYKRVMGWKKVADALDKVYKQNNTTLLFNDRTTMAEMIYYINPHPFSALMYNPTGKVKNQYNMDNSLKTQIGESFLYVTKQKNIDNLKKSFQNTHYIKSINIPLYKDFNRSYYLYLLEEFKGYQ